MLASALRCGRLNPGEIISTTVAYHRAVSPLDYLGIHIPTIVEDNVSIRCDGCLEVIQFGNKISEEAADVHDDAECLETPPVDQLGECRWVDVNTDGVARRREQVSHGNRMEHGRQHQGNLHAAANVGRPCNG